MFIVRQEELTLRTGTIVPSPAAVGAEADGVAHASSAVVRRFALQSSNVSNPSKAADFYLRANDRQVLEVSLEKDTCILMRKD